MGRKHESFIEVVIPASPGQNAGGPLMVRNRLRDAVEAAIEPLGGQVDGAGIDMASGIGDFTCVGAAIEPIFVAALGAIEHSSPPAGTSLTAYLAHGRKLVHRW